MEADSVNIRYFKEQVEKGIRDIFRAQKAIADSKIYNHERGQYHPDGSFTSSRSGVLRQALSSPSFSVAQSGGGIVSNTSLPVYIRFLDMKRNGNLGIYNRQVWGILYRETLGNIKYEYRQWLRKNVSELLQQNNKQSKS